ncbi:MAG: exopolyphosphatase [Candidatus Synechococcus spongiarum 15L]|uniref:Exopolyphosphatase n=2 Tax=Candidatus Synechococcus spongiarum TaxID=431041 RepID=A0A1T1D6K6_9SYNE|nr:Ppx/GppA phosphatase family protein [Candidatus Synechococcus spongiarum]KKZ09927.1 MAG: exopolyphosphatase [Candidatus Synechococcus spongiarum 15L]OOV36485.1 exopolyphosphatase [Candidatus Synechococcus spongiarum LMB bulk15N]
MASDGTHGALPLSREVRVAAVDIGTNSVHMVLAAVDQQLRSFSVLTTEKTPVRLGERDPETGDLTSQAMERAMQALNHCRQLADSHGSHAVVGVATSAVREAGNGREFLALVEQKLGFQVDLVDGREEARLIYLGVLSAMDFAGAPHLILDIGGGSTELILADSHDTRSLSSLRVGAVRLAQDFGFYGALTTERVQFLKTFIQGMLEPAVCKVQQRLAVGESPVLVCTSGTAMAIGSLLALRLGTTSRSLNGLRFGLGHVQELMQELVTLDVEQCRRLPGLSERRADIIVTGGLILETAMELLNTQEMVLCKRALREGLIVNWMLHHNLIVDRFAYQSNIRRRTILHQAQKYGVDRERAERVARHALLLFEACRHDLDPVTAEARELLWGAAMLHACGRHISSVGGYHKHSWYLVRHCTLLGYSESEHLILAALVRYHRRSSPRKRHEAWLSLQDAGQQRCVQQLSPLLRIAVALDRRPQAVVERLDVVLTARTMTVRLTPFPGANISLECWSLDNCRTEIEPALGRKLRVEVVEALAAAAAG